MLSHVRPLCAVLMQYSWDQQYPLGSIDTQVQGVGVKGGDSDASVYIMNWRCNFVMRVVAARSYSVIVSFVVDNVPTAWGLAVVALARFASDWEWVCSICSWTAAFACPLDAQM